MHERMNHTNDDEPQEPNYTINSQSSPDNNKGQKLRDNIVKDYKYKIMVDQSQTVNESNIILDTLSDYNME